MIRHADCLAQAPVFIRCLIVIKKSIALDLKTDAGREAVLRLIATADVLIENFKTGAMEKLGLGEAELRRRYPRLIYVSHKGFLPGPYADRTALDEVVQMMGGLAI